ncbi:Retrovirus-related Pol polyprotein like [Argiope bruennichi]|uniref:Retrovirus-related Pol polyprotein like n=1 Tax=Argiope bruennichi TaxID=94029 RepID=A0A8T0F247_ARGBR|nr:Retrovirus-related Pol polyprotein like [Argiope bruennichi]
MSFRPSNAAATFQRFIYHVLSGMDFCVPYFDDVLVASESNSQHLEHLKKVFRRLEEYGVRLNASKCVLGKSSVKFLGGHIVSPDGLIPLPEKVSAITELPNQVPGYFSAAHNTIPSSCKWTSRKIPPATKSSSIMAHGKVQWSLALPTILFEFRATWKEDLEATTAEVLYGAPISIPGEFFIWPPENISGPYLSGQSRSINFCGETES